MTVSEEQIGYLSRAEFASKHGDVKEVVGIISHVLADSEIRSGKEELDQGWANLWAMVRKDAKRFAPVSVIDEISEAIGRIKLVDDELWNTHLASEQSLVVLLGAGASKPPPSNIPVITEFLPELWRRARKLDREDLNRLAKWCDDNGISNIEDLLTAAQIANFSTKSSGILTLLFYFLYSRAEPPRIYRTEEGRLMPRPSGRPQPSDLGACLSKLSPAGKKRGLPSSGYRISSINQEIRWEKLSAGSNNLCPQAIF